eukprot:24356-Heterocapsa_arctica.AAC.1
MRSHGDGPLPSSTAAVDLPVNTPADAFRMFRINGSTKEAASAKSSAITRKVGLSMLLGITGRRRSGGAKERL